MSRLMLGVLCGLVWGVLTVLSMLPLTFPDKNAALTGAFFNRFAIGVVLGAVIGAPHVSALGMPPWLVGIIFALLISASDAIVTKAYVPVLVLGAMRRGPRVHRRTVGRVTTAWISCACYAFHVSARIVVKKSVCCP